MEYLKMLVAYVILCQSKNIRKAISQQKPHKRPLVGFSIPFLAGWLKP